MKLLNVLVFLFAIFAFSTTHSYAQSEVKNVLQGEKKEQESSNRRRKKVMMCHECGKPEHECECEGEGHGADNENQNEDH